MATHPKNTPLEKHSDIPVWNAEDWYWEDITPGRQIRSIRRTLSEGECMLFNSFVLDMHPYVADEPFARNGLFGRRLVAGAMVFSVGLGLVATNCKTHSVTDTTVCALLRRFLSATPYTRSRRIWTRRRKAILWVCTGRPTRFSRMTARWFSIASTCRP